MIPLSDRYLIDRIREGSEEAFDYVFRNYYSNLCRYAFRFIKDESQSEDLVMDVFVRFWESAPDINITSSLPGYLYQSVHNHCINYLTRHHNRFRNLDPETTEKLFSVLKESGCSDPLISTDLSELSAQIQNSIEKLPEECRKIFIMSRNEDLPHKEIARQLGISENTVKVQIYRALKKFRVLLRDFLPGNDGFDHD